MSNVYPKALVIIFCSNIVKRWNVSICPYGLLHNTLVRWNIFELDVDFSFRKPVEVGFFLKTLKHFWIGCWFFHQKTCWSCSSGARSWAAESLWRGRSLRRWAGISFGCVNSIYLFIFIDSNTTKFQNINRKMTIRPIISLE